jgi:hypothetical protein
VIQATISGLIETGRIDDQPVEAVARMLTGALIEGGMMIAEAGDERLARKQVGEAVQRLFRGLAA